MDVSTRMLLSLGPSELSAVERCPYDFNMEVSTRRGSTAQINY